MALLSPVAHQWIEALPAELRPFAGSIFRRLAPEAGCGRSLVQLVRPCAKVRPPEERELGRALLAAIAADLNGAREYAAWHVSEAKAREAAQARSRAPQQRRRRAGKR